MKNKECALYTVQNTKYNLEAWMLSINRRESAWQEYSARLVYRNFTVCVFFCFQVVMRTASDSLYSVFFLAESFFHLSLLLCNIFCFLFIISYSFFLFGHNYNTPCMFYQTSKKYKSTHFKSEFSESVILKSTQMQRSNIQEIFNLVLTYDVLAKSSCFLKPVLGRDQFNKISSMQYRKL